MADPVSGTLAASQIGASAGAGAASTKAAAPALGAADLAGSEAAGISMAPSMLGAPGSSLMANLGTTSAGGGGLSSVLGSNLQQLGVPPGLAGRAMQAQMGAKALGLPGLPGLSAPQMPQGGAPPARPFNQPMAPSSALGTLQQMTPPLSGGGSMGTAGLVGNRMGGMGGIPPQLLLQLLASRGTLQ